jgi:hypothetical protein
LYSRQFDLPDHGFLLLTWSTGPMKWSTGNSYQAEATKGAIRSNKSKKDVDNTMAKRKRGKRTNNDLQNTTQKTKDLVTQCVNPNKKQRGWIRWSCSIVLLSLITILELFRQFLFIIFCIIYFLIEKEKTFLGHKTKCIMIKFIPVVSMDAQKNVKYQNPRPNTNEWVIVV